MTRWMASTYACHSDRESLLGGEDEPEVPALKEVAQGSEREDGVRHTKLKVVERDRIRGALGSPGSWVGWVTNS